MFYGPEGVLLGSAKTSESRKRAREERMAQEEAARNERLLELEKDTVEAQISALRAQFASREEEVRRKIRATQDSADSTRADRESVTQLRNEAGRNVSTNGGRA